MTPAIPPAPAVCFWRHRQEAAAVHRSMAAPSSILPAINPKMLLFSNVITRFSTVTSQIAPPARVLATAPNTALTGIEFVVGAPSAAASTTKFVAEP